MSEAERLRTGGVGVIPTDTLYGLVASTAHEPAIERVYALKRRARSKPSIILIASLADLELFGVQLTPAQRRVLSRYWPGPTSIVLPCDKTAPMHLHGGTGSLAFRLPDDPELRAFLADTGPLIAPSANPEGLPPASSIDEARAYFGDQVDFYIDRGVRAGKASTLISCSAVGAVTTLRE